MMRVQRFRRFLLALALCCSLPLMRGADTEQAHQEKLRFERVGNKMQCMCGCNDMLLKCNHVGCTVSLAMIRDLQASIKVRSSDDEVLDWFRHNYGVTAVILPSTHGFELTAWIVPPTVLGIGLMIYFFVIVTWRRRTPPVAAGTNVAIDPNLESLRSRARQETEI